MAPDAPKPVPASEEGTEIMAVSDETKALVEKNMPNESDQVKQKFGELVEAIKQQATQEVESAESMSKEAYVEAVEQAQATLKRAQDFFYQQEQTLETNVNQVRDEATQQWEKIVADMQDMGNRVERAVNAAWTILTEPTDSDQSGQS
ncbi:hypothetical protein C7271_19705 [filamentous cyanobacterium CCP5]|nr:hypothetical protein C7271_19705 [filamentous cyanobacterium CCP5]